MSHRILIARDSTFFSSYPLDLSISVFLKFSAFNDASNSPQPLLDLPPLSLLPDGRPDGRKLHSKVAKSKTLIPWRLPLTWLAAVNRLCH